ncbi:MAG TPA: enolase C-terminal domain-like protein [Pirellulales bacterium]|nr:enolase C-terminal domain-like protein [Pirellulales bacterium]
MDIERIRTVAAQLQPRNRLVADANTGWLAHDALLVVRAVRDIDVYIEQTCVSYEECLAVRRHCEQPFVLDEVIDGVDVVIHQSNFVVNLSLPGF